MKSINPATGQLRREYDAYDDDEIEARLRRAVVAQAAYGALPVTERAARLAEAARRLSARREELGRLMTGEMGKVYRAALSEVDKCAWVCRFYAENGEDLLRDEIVETDASESRVRYDPLGVVLAIMPWNFPLWQVFRFAAPSLLAGNAGLLKHASNVPGCALAIEEVLREAGVPEGAFQALLVPAARAEKLVADPRIAAVTLTGSEPAGRAVASAAGEHLKKSLLELGGSDPFIVFGDADLGRAVDTAIQARIINNGQSCIAAKRFIVVGEVADEFERRLVTGMERLTVGDPMDPDTDIGPLATPAIREGLHEQVRGSVEAGAVLRTGGEVPAGEGWYYPPTVLTDVPRDCPAAVEELFGPVAPVFRVGDEDEAVELANATSFGLGAAVWTRDGERARRCIERIEAGSVFVNGMVASDPRLPFGGIKRSGFGRELGRHGLLEFVNVKTVWIGDDGISAR